MGTSLLPKFINIELKTEHGLVDTAKPKPLAGVDNLLLLLTQHWARDKSVYRTEDDRHDVATIMLFKPTPAVDQQSLFTHQRVKPVKTRWGTKKQQTREIQDRNRNEENNNDCSLDSTMTVMLAMGLGTMTIVTSIASSIRMRTTLTRILRPSTMTAGAEPKKWMSLTEDIDDRYVTELNEFRGKGL